MIVISLDPALDLTIEPIGEAARIARVGFLEPAWLAINVHPIDRDALLLQVIDQQSVIVSGTLDKDDTALGRSVRLNVLEKLVKAVAVVGNYEDWAALECAVALKQGHAHHANGVMVLAHVDADVEILICRRHGHGRTISLSSLGHTVPP